jgi:uncharacterized protein
MSFEDAIKVSSDGTIIDLEVSPGSKETKVPSGYNEWRKRIEAKLKAPPEKGKANEELIKALSGLLKVPASSMTITSGATDSRKSIKVHGMSREDVINIMRSRV